MKTAVYMTKYSYIKIGFIDDKVVLIKRVDSLESSEKTEFSDFVINEINEYFAGKRKEFTFKYEISGTEFQKKVYNALLNIKYGEVKSYQDIAIEIGNINASRAVGNANNKNPLLFVVPCHRVIGKKGSLVGYASGIELKQSLLEMERTN